MEALGQCIPPPRHALDGSGSGSMTRITTKSFVHRQPISCKFVRKFLHKVANRQINRQTNNDDYITFLAKVINDTIKLKITSTA